MSKGCISYLTCEFGRMVDAEITRLHATNAEALSLELKLRQLIEIEKSNAEFAKLDARKVHALNADLITALEYYAKVGGTVARDAIEKAAAKRMVGA